MGLQIQPGFLSKFCHFENSWLLTSTQSQASSQTAQWSGLGPSCRPWYFKGKEKKSLLYSFKVAYSSKQVLTIIDSRRLTRPCQLSQVILACPQSLLWYIAPLSSWSSLLFQSKLNKVQLRGTVTFGILRGGIWHFQMLHGSQGMLQSHKKYGYSIWNIIFTK